MNQIILRMLCAIFVASILIGCSNRDHSNDNEISVSEFDSLKATQLGADEYGMRKYVMAFITL